MNDFKDFKSNNLKLIFKIKGDSGGPLYTQIQVNNQTRYEVVGVTSYGGVCGSSVSGAYENNNVLYFRIFLITTVFLFWSLSGVAACMHRDANAFPEIFFCNYKLLLMLIKIHKGRIYAFILMILHWHPIQSTAVNV